jgi:hypothetical protein
VSLLLKTKYIYIKIIELATLWIESKILNHPAMEAYTINYPIICVFLPEKSYLHSTPLSKQAVFTPPEKQQTATLEILSLAQSNVSSRNSLLINIGSFSQCWKWSATNCLFPQSLLSCLLDQSHQIFSQQNKPLKFLFNIKEVFNLKFLFIIKELFNF